jgi:hypothetical protein
MDEGDLAVLIFRGGIHSDVISLRAVLEANVIETSLETSALAGMGITILPVGLRPLMSSATRLPR